jgi:hypothetical protein
MQTGMKVPWPEASLSRLLEAFEQEILEASDEEIMEAAKELGMNPAMKGSAAFMDVKYAIGLRSRDIYGIHAWLSALTEEEKIALEVRMRRKDETSTSIQVTTSRQRKNPGSK